MTKIVITLETDNAAFDDLDKDSYSREVLEVLEGADFHDGGPLRDRNGNTIGGVTVEY